MSKKDPNEEDQDEHKIVCRNTHATRSRVPWSGRKSFSRKKRFREKRKRNALVAAQNTAKTQGTLRPDNYLESDSVERNIECDDDNSHNDIDAVGDEYFRDDNVLTDNIYAKIIDDLNGMEEAHGESYDLFNSNIEIPDKYLHFGSKSLNNKELSRILEISEDEEDQDFEQITTSKFIEFLEKTKSIIQAASTTAPYTFENNVESVNAEPKDKIFQFLKSLKLTTEELMQTLDSENENEREELNEYTLPRSTSFEKDNQNDALDNEKKEPELHKTIVDMNYFLETFQKISRKHTASNTKCEPYNMHLVNISREGFKSKFEIQCTRCNFITRINSEPEDSDMLDINRAAVSGSLATGIGFSQLKELSSAMDIPCMASNTYIRYQSELIHAFKKSAEDSMRVAGEMEVLLAKERGDVKNGIPTTKVVADGTFLRRTYVNGKHDSNCGMAIIVGYYTQLILFMGCRNKYCYYCSQAEKMNNTPKKHTCYKNFDSKKCASSMETEIISDGFKCSVEQHGLIYEYLIADGDCNVYNKILQDDPYESYGITVKKIECTNHLLRNLARHLKDVGKGRKKVSQWKKIVTNNILRIRSSIKKAVKFRKNENVEIEEKVARLRNDLLNLPYHVFGEHKNCASYFCKGPKKDEINYVEEMETVGIFAEVEEAMSRVNCNCYSLLEEVSSNIVEQCNSVLAKIIGGKRINWGLTNSYECRCYISVTQCNTHRALSRLASFLGKKPSTLITDMENNRISKNLYNKVHSELSQIFSGKSSFDKASIKSEKKDKFYGDNCERPDLNEVEYKVKLDATWTKLINMQKNRQEIEIRTRKQRDSKDWFEIRKMLLTASNFKEVCRRRDSTPCANLVKKILFPNMTSTRATVWGVAMERRAKESYEQIYKKSVKECGLFIDEEIPYLGASPDGLIDTNGILEIKCPFEARDMKVDDGIRLKKGFLKNLMKNNSLDINESHSFYYQIQGQLRISRREYCDLFIWTLIDTKRIRIVRDDEFWRKKMLPFLSKFYTRCLLPEIVDSRIKRQMPVREPKSITQKVSNESEKVKSNKKKSNEKSNRAKRIKLEITPAQVIENEQSNIVGQSNDEKTSMGEQYENGLLKNLSYYIQNHPLVSTVSSYTCNEMKEFAGMSKKVLWSEDTFTLSKDEWISGSIVDAFMILQWKTKWRFQNVTFVTSEMTNFIIGDRRNMSRSSSWFMYNLEWNYTGKVFIPYCRSGHWCLIVLDVDNKIFYHVNPKKRNDIDEKIYEDIIFNEMIQYFSDCCNFKKFNLCNIIWERKEFTDRRPMQSDQDIVNCGVYVILYMYHIAEESKMPETFCPDQYRKYILEKLISSSDSMNNTCLMCLNSTLAQSHKSCKQCSRWIHERCSEKRVTRNKNEFKEISVISEKEVCIFCQSMNNR